MPCVKSRKRITLAKYREDGCAQSVKRQRAPSGMAKKVLIVEDNDLNMKLFRDLLQRYGFETIETAEGSRVIELAREHRPNLIIMDIQLPGVSGIEVTQWLKSDPELSPIPIVAVTAFAMKGDEERIRGGGCEAYISKPITVRSFLDTIQRFVT